MLLESDRINIRELEAEDVDCHIDMMLDPKTAQFLTPDAKPRTRPEEWRAAASLIGHWAIRGFGFFTVIEKDSGAWVGRVGPWMPEGWPGLECGWSIKSEHWGKGYAPEAAIAAIGWTFDRFPDLERIISVIDPDNANSQGVAKKVGEEKSNEIFEFWGHRLDVWAAGREAWLARFA